jgi:hypothetical protein
VRLRERSERILSEHNEDPAALAGDEHLAAG